ncbi:MAG TPA: hypothetical protein VLR94_08085, partial [Acidobacteriota bacterium]|nr:hypothetical protein [Acidobacteriota bacterium]
VQCSRGTEPGNVKPSTEPAPTPAAPSTSGGPSAPAPLTSHDAVPTAAPATAGSVAGIAGIEWTIPASWKLQPDRPMRVVTYSIPAAAGDSEGAECAVFFFGSGQGGNVRANIDRWIGQFETDSKPKESTNVVNGIQVTTVDIAGTYLAPGGPMMQSQGKKTGYRLLGTIVEAPEGAVFFKTTGPAASVTASEKDITGLVNSIHKSH